MTQRWFASSFAPGAPLILTDQFNSVQRQALPNLHFQCHSYSGPSSQVVNQIKELVWLKTTLPEKQSKRFVFTQQVPTAANPPTRAMVGAEGHCPSASAGLCQAQRVRKMGCKVIAFNAWEVHFRIDLLPSACGCTVLWQPAL